MKAFGADKAATQHYRKERKQATGGPEEGDEPQKYRLEEGDGTTHAQRIVRELYLRYEKQLQRWKDYRNLFVFLAFVTLFLAVLYLQRNADVAYKVHSTIESVVVPKNDVMQNTEEVYNWLDGLLTEVWKDPVCGDGLCEAPFEFASYSRFGCRADCGKLSEVQNLTKIQVDVYYDFSHPVGSIPASDLMQQASWNLCPLQTPYSTDCYYDSDVTFDRLSGTQNYYIDDAPDGKWNLVVKRDIFNKVKGAVRDTVLVTTSGYFYKIYIAAAAAQAEQQFEISLLQRAISISGTEFWKYADSTIRAGLSSSTEYNVAKDWIRNATCYCSNVINGTDVFGTRAMTLYLNQSVSRTSSSQPFSLAYDEYLQDTYYCPNVSAIVPYQWKSYNDTNGTTYKQLDPVNLSNSSAVTDWCSGGLSLSITWRNNMTQTVQRLVIDTRLGDQRTTGKIAVRNTVNLDLRNFLIANNPELIVPIYTTPSGTVALADPISARMDYLMDLYVKGVAFSQQYASFNITRSYVYDFGVHLLNLIPRIQSRVDEVNYQITDVRSIPLPAPMDKYANGNVTYVFKNTTVGALYDAFTTAGATNSSLPKPDNSTLDTFAIAYNLARWDGNTTAYMLYDLDSRGREYLGQCVAMNNTCIATTNDTVPYNCTDLTNGNMTIPGSLRNSSYRTLCEMPCDRRFDCNTLCECFGTCASTEYCECDACTQLSVSATADDQFQSIVSVVTDQATAAAMIASVNTNSPSVRRLARRRLLETSNDQIASQLSDVLSKVGTVATKQDSISSQMTELQKQVDRANALAEARAKDQTVLNAITTGRAEIAAGQARVEAKLDEIIGKQQQSLEAAQTAITAINAIKGLAERQIDAQQQLEARVVEQLGAIQIATKRDVITLTQALALWKRARRDRALTLKAAKLANIPCNSNPTEENNFELNNNNTVDTTTSRERNVGLTNRVIAGLLLHQTRTNETECPSSKFDKIQKTCTGPRTISSYGVDPVFKRGTQLYDPDFDDVAGQKVVGFYNCSLLSDATYNVNFLNQTVNKQPYCAELFNPQGLPYAFHFFPLEQKEDGFPVYFDINLSEDGAQSWFNYIKEGLYLDQNTRTMTAELVTYNAQLHIFSYYYIKFFFSDGGSIKITYRLNTVRVELYDTYSNHVRYGFEIVLCMWIFAMLLYNLYEIGYAQVKHRNFLKYFLSGWHWVEFASNGLLTACMIIWWIFKEEYASKFDILIRYDVYDQLSPVANFLALNAEDLTAVPGANLMAVNNAFADLRELVDMLNWYFALNGINILLLIARVLKLMDFQPRLGVVTRSLWLAGPDLIHFAIVAGMVFVGYAMMAHLIFGNAIESFATFGDSINTCFEILLGNIDVNNELRALGGLQSVAGALFFWSYELLVFMVLLNFLLAIIVDAFSEVKEKTHETVGIHTELFTLLRDKWRSLLGRFSPNYISDAKLGDLLRQWAGEDDEDKGDNGGDVDKRKLLTILNEDMDEETLREVFKECLRDAPDNTDKAKAAASAGLFSRLVHGGHAANTADVSEEEILMAAHYIVERFGSVPEDDGDEDFEGDGLDSAAQLPAAANAGPGGSATGALTASNREVVLEKERDQLAQALERLAEVQRELADGQRNLMNGQKQLAEQQSKLVQLMNEQPPAGN